MALKGKADTKRSVTNEQLQMPEANGVALYRNL